MLLEEERSYSYLKFCLITAQLEVTQKTQTRRGPNGIQDRILALGYSAVISPQLLRYQVRPRNNQLTIFQVFFGILCCYCQFPSIVTLLILKRSKRCSTAVCSACLGTFFSSSEVVNSAVEMDLIKPLLLQYALRLIDN